MIIKYFEFCDCYMTNVTKMAYVFKLHCNECVWIIPGTEKDDSDE